MSKRVKSLCKNCGYQGYPKIKTPGYFAVELILWCLLILPGLCYSLWRILNKYTICPICGQPHMIPIYTPIAKQMLIDRAPAHPPPDNFIELPDSEPDPADILQPQDEQGRYIIE